MIGRRSGPWLAILLGLSVPVIAACSGAALAETGVAADLSRWTGAGADVHVRGAPGAERLEITFQPGSYPNARVSTSTPWDWRGQSLALKLTNPTGMPVAFNVRVDDDPAADGKKHTRAGSGTLQAHETATVALSLAPPPARPASLRGLPPIEPGAPSLPSCRAPPFDPDHL